MNIKDNNIKHDTKIGAALLFVVFTIIRVPSKCLVTLNIRKTRNTDNNRINFGTVEPLYMIETAISIGKGRMDKKSNQFKRSRK